MNNRDIQFAEIWNQNVVPALFRQGQGKPFLVRLPEADDEWLIGTSRRTPPWNDKYRCREVPISWFDKLIKRLVRRYGEVYLIQAYKVHQRCVPACWNAKGVHCECSCMGMNHGAGHPSGRWYTISKSIILNLEERKYACRLINRKV